ncbi:MAG: glycosyltransferase family 39 protein [Phycisphaerales bacterium]|nr:MAG: glycosyltransferase family 39 protein [Phycisphaerales bacterium]
MSQEVLPRRNIRGEKLLIAYFIVAKLILCLYPCEYGFFRDELYYIALSDNLDFGYVDVPPIVPFLLSLVRSVLGTSFFSLHLLPAVSGALVVWLVSLMVRKMGGGFNALLLALTCVTFAPIYLCWESTYTYDAFDKLCWTLLLYLLVLLLKTDDKKYWVYFGIVAGLALLTKITVLFLGFGVFAALLMTRARRYFLSRQLWMGVILALLISSPYVLWQIKEGIPALEYYGNYASGKTWPSKPLEFITNQILIMNPLAFPVWLLGICYFIFHREGKKYRVLAFAYIVVLVICIILKVKFYLSAPFYTVLFAGGAVFIEEFAETRKIKKLRRMPAVAIFLTGLVMVPFARPILPIESFMKYTGRSVWERIKGERHRLGRLPQHYADRFGWEEMVVSIANVYDQLNEEDKSEACVLMGNYGQAGAIWALGEKYGLPRPISGHLQYFFWGTRGHTGEVVISLGITRQTLREYFNSVEKVSEHTCVMAIPYERYLDVNTCRSPKKPLDEMWPNFKHLD